MHPRFFRLWALALGVVTALGVTTVPANAAPAREVSPTTVVSEDDAIVCYVEHRVIFSSQDNYLADVKITNKSSASAISNWILSWTFNSAAKVEHAWNVLLGQSGQNVVAVGPEWAPHIAAGKTATFGYFASGPYSPGPTNFRVNGTECTTWPPPTAPALVREVSSWT
jgi:hypothetical protein